MGVLALLTLLAIISVSSQKTYFNGHIIEDGVKRDLEAAPQGEVYSTCAAWKNAGYTTNGNYMIDPDGPAEGVKEFKVECLMNSYDGKAITIIHHNQEGRTNAGSCEKALSCVVPVSYGSATMEQILSLMHVSGECKQYIKLDCIGSKFGFDLPSPLTTHHGWYSRDGALMDYWGGASPGSKKCACGMLNSCDKPGRACNCDANDQVWRSDAGYLDDIEALPVTKMAFGDLGSSSESAYYRLGALQCYGLINQ